MIISPTKIADSFKRTPLAKVDVNRRRPGRGQPTTNPERLIPTSGKWTIDAVAYLKDAFRELPLSKELIEAFQTFEKNTGYQNSKVRYY